MTKRALLITTIATVLAGAGVAHAEQPGYDYNPNRYSDSPTLLASVAANHGFRPVWIEVSDGERYDQLTLVARGGAVLIDDLVIRFENGRAIRVDVPRRIRNGEAITIDLPGDGRRIDAIQIDYADRRMRRRRAVLDVYGVENDRLDRYDRRDDRRFERRYDRPVWSPRARRL